VVVWDHPPHEGNSSLKTGVIELPIFQGINLMQMHAKFEGIPLNSARFGLVTQLGGGFKYVFFFTPKIGEDEFDEYFFRWGGSNTNYANLRSFSHLFFMFIWYGFGCFCCSWWYSFF